MSETGARPARSRIWKYLLWLMLAGGLVLLAVGWYSTTESFRALVRQRLIATLEHSTGGRVELGSIHVVPFHFQVEVRELTIHGREGPREIPYAHVNSLMAQVKPWSLLRSGLGLNYVVLDHPVVHIILYSDGTTNQPEPKVKATSSKKTMEQLFALSISRLEVRRGELIWGNQRMPLDFALRDVSADMSYSLFHGVYEGNVLLGKADTAFSGYRPIAWTAEAHFTLGRSRIQLRSLKATSGRSRLQATGQVENFRQPKVVGDYELSLDLAEAAAIIRRPEVRRGVLQLTGHGSWSAEDFSSIGKALLSNLDWRDAPIGVHNASLSAQYAMDPRRLVLSLVQGQVLGGSVTGDADVAQWLPQPAGINAREKPTNRQSGSARLRFKDLSAAEIAAAVATASRPFERIKPAGLVSGKVDASWKDSIRNTEAQFVADVRAAAGNESSISAHRARPGHLPFRPGRVGTCGIDRRHPRNPGACFRHAFLQCSAQTRGEHDEPRRMAAGFQRRGIRRTDSGNAQRARLVQRYGHGKAQPDRHRGQRAVAGLRDHNSGHRLHPRENDQLERPAGRHSAVTLGVRRAQRHAEPRS